MKPSYDEFVKLGERADRETRHQVAAARELANERQGLVRMLGVEPGSAHAAYVEFMIGFSIGMEAARIALGFALPWMDRGHHELIGETFARERVPGIEVAWLLGYGFVLDQKYGTGSWPSLPIPPPSADTLGR